MHRGRGMETHYLDALICGWWKIGARRAWGYSTFERGRLSMLRDGHLPNPPSAIASFPRQLNSADRYRKSSEHSLQLQEEVTGDVSNGADNGAGSFVLSKPANCAFETCYSRQLAALVTTQILIHGKSPAD